MSTWIFILTEKCNWNCEYCDFPDIENPQNTTIEKIQKHLPYIKEIIDKLNSKKLVYHMDVQGGEMGMLDIEVIKYFLTTLQLPIEVSTNGLFLEKGYHKDKVVRKYVKRILWHLCESPGKFKLNKTYNDDEIFISKGIVHNNIYDMLKFIEVNNDILFDYIEFEYDIKKENKVDKKKYEQLYASIKDLDNVTQNAKNIIESRIEESPHLREWCRSANVSICINLVREKICLCQRNYDHSIPLTKENLYYRLKNFPSKIFKTDNCDSCTRLFAGKFVKDETLKRSLRVKGVV